MLKGSLLIIILASHAKCNTHTGRMLHYKKGLWILCHTKYIKYHHLYKHKNSIILTIMENVNKWTPTSVKLGGREIIHLRLKQFVTLLIIKWTETKSLEKRTQ